MLEPNVLDHELDARTAVDANIPATTGVAVEPREYSDRRARVNEKANDVA
jgi:hypothetical protein